MNTQTETNFFETAVTEHNIHFRRLQILFNASTLLKMSENIIKELYTLDLQSDPDNVGLTATMLEKLKEYTLFLQLREDIARNEYRISYLQSL